MTTISGAGGTTIYIDQTYLNSLTFPCTVQNTNTLSGFLTVQFSSDITITTSNSYFICGSSHIQFGSSSLKTDGTRPVITIDGVTGYPGLIQNGTSGLTGDGYSNIHVYNLVVDTLNGSTLSNNQFGGIGSGWIGQTYYGRGSIANYIINCSSTGPISVCSGGILGTYAGPTVIGDKAAITILGCSSSGTIAPNGGGIIGQLAAGTGWGDITCESCWSTGVIGMNGGGIMGLGAGARSGTVVTLSNCYSTGTISTNAGGICGVYCGGSIADSGSIAITNCYSTGIIQNGISGGAGGIVGGSCAENTIITNCYSTGAIADNAGGIVGNTPSILQTNITRCYTTGIVTGLSLGYIIAGSGDIPATCYGEGSGSWNSTNAGAALQGTPTQTVGTTWVSTGVNQPYELRNMGYTPYTIQNINATPALNRSFSSSIVAGNSSVAAILSGMSYTLLQGSNGTITIDSTTGVISTTSGTSAGTYTLYIRNTGSYFITEYTLSITTISAVCCEKPLFFRGVIDNKTLTELRGGNTLIGGISARRGPVSYSDLMSVKKAYAAKQ